MTRFAALSHRYSRYWWMFSVIVWAAIGAWLLYDRAPPPLIVFTARFVPPPDIRPGKQVMFTVDVDRDLTRRCSATVVRHLITSRGEILPYGERSQVSREGLEIRDAIDPDHIRVPITIPETMPPGRSHLLTELFYRCPMNPTTYLFPIEVTYELPFDVLPVEQETGR